MKINIPVLPSKFDDVPIGGFFAKKTDFGLCVSIDGKKRAAIIFSETVGPRLQYGGMPYQVLYYPDATAQVDLNSAVPRTDQDPAYGALIKSANGKTYIRVVDSAAGDYRTFDVATGMQGNLPDDPAVAYLHWKVGLQLDGEFMELLDVGGSLKLTGA
ncbi:hypothetical protein ACVIHI_002657 [Bradyrhizobium sp. USDA 4524]|uniref:hypothetical protein n=1 Tax=unclassified Bradyrhizobium TaxID=2631580 RepID=UPI00209FAEA1|nr:MULTISPECIES: hypothetical protein [unclassified Bradyrhizobium]MCP1844422.1 hypothetical protein [Bradyrhizobium sp. USDA 4538]MCP1904988.1 hypothetical protein [Bradyrhizobium sp. USDA 4537]MCP1989356.1 hypothetical protein [Bradyrhizobium sp. USDA 4539]